MVAYLQKSEGSEGFHQIIDFLNASHIQYAFIENPTIYVSFITQFWRTTTARTSANGEVELTATIDGQVKTITEAFLRKHLKLEDNGGVTTLPNSKIFEQLALMRYVTDSDKLTFQKVPPSTSQPPNTQPTPTAKEAVPMPHESHLHSVHLLGRDEGSVSLNELTDLCTSLSKKVRALDNELQQTKNTYSTAITKLILRVKKLEQKVKTTKAKRRARIVLSEDEEDVEDSSKQGRKISEINTDPSISLVQDEGPLCTVIPEVSTATANLVYLRRSAWKRKDKGKTIMEEDESVQKNTKKQLKQERLGHEEAIRLPEQIDEEERQRITRDAEIAKQLQEEINKATQEQEKQEAVTKADLTHVIDWSDPAVADGSSKNYKIFSKMLDDFDRQDVLDLHRLVEERYATSRPEGYDLMLWGDLKILFQPDEEDEVWRHQHEYNLISWRLFDSCGIHILLMDNGIAIHMMIEKKYPLTQEMLSKMLSRKLEVDHENEMVFELLRIQLSIFIQKTSSSTATTSSADLQQQLYLNMKAKPQDQAADPEIWEILKAKSENP
ncbi:hypothetical protein Tco_1347140 [Tanacetum coccineum]